MKIEHEILRARGIHLPHGVEIDVDDILVAGQHEAFFDHVAGALLGVGGGAIADFDPLLLGDVRLDHASDRVRQVVAKALTGGAGVFAEDHIDADLARPHRIEPCQKPDDDGAEKKRDKPFAAHRAAGHDGFQTILAAAEDIFEIGWGTVALWAAGTPRALAAARSAALPPGASAAALVTPRHRSLFLTLKRPAVRKPIG